MNSHTEHILYTIFKRRIGTTLAVAITLTIAFYFGSPTIAIALGVATALLIVWWIVFIING